MDTSGVIYLLYYNYYYYTRWCTKKQNMLDFGMQNANSIICLYVHIFSLQAQTTIYL